MYEYQKQNFLDKIFAITYYICINLLQEHQQGNWNKHANIKMEGYRVEDRMLT